MTAVCINCLHNTQGNMCSECIADYYRTNTSVMDPNHCAGYNNENVHVIKFVL